MSNSNGTLCAARRFRVPKRRRCRGADYRIRFLIRRFCSSRIIHHVNHNHSATTPVVALSPASTTASTTTAGSLPTLTPTNFLNMMVTQLQNQDPLNPTSSSDLLAQMSQIGQLQSSTSLQTTLQNFGLQTSLSSASSMIGKNVQGLDATGNPSIRGGHVRAGAERQRVASVGQRPDPRPGQRDEHFARSHGTAATTTMSTTTPIVAGH